MPLDPMAGKTARLSSKANTKTCAKDCNYIPPVTVCAPKWEACGGHRGRSADLTCPLTTAGMGARPICKWTGGACQPNHSINPCLGGGAQCGKPGTAYEYCKLQEQAAPYRCVVNRDRCAAKATSFTSSQADQDACNGVVAGPANTPICQASVRKLLGINCYLNGNDPCGDAGEDCAIPGAPYANCKLTR